MEKSDRQPVSRLDSAGSDISLARGLAFGVLGSFLGTLGMDVVMVVESLMIGQPINTHLAVIGSAMGGGVILGALIHYLLLPAAVGLIFGAAVLKINLLRITTTGKGVGLGLLFGIVTIPLGCVPTAILSGVPIIQFVSFSAVPHVVWGAILGWVAAFGLRTPAEANPV